MTSRPGSRKSHYARKAHSAPGRPGRRWWTRWTSAGGETARPCPRPLTPAGLPSARCPAGEGGSGSLEGREGDKGGARERQGKGPSWTESREARWRGGAGLGPGWEDPPPRTLQCSGAPAAPGLSRPPSMASRRRSSMLTLQWRPGRLRSGGSHTCGERAAGRRGPRRQPPFTAPTQHALTLRARSLSGQGALSKAPSAQPPAAPAPAPGAGPQAVWPSVALHSNLCQDTPQPSTCPASCTAGLPLDCLVLTAGPPLDRQEDPRSSNTVVCLRKGRTKASSRPPFSPDPSEMIIKRVREKIKMNP